jgi:adenosylcobyric acid synthase
MMGETISDPDGVESRAGAVPGLGLLAADTVMQHEKTTRVRRARLESGLSCAAYEIHMGCTTPRTSYPPFARLDDGATDGMAAPRLIGTYLHGALEDPAVCSAIFKTDVRAGEEGAARYAALADWFNAHAVSPADWLPRAR